MYMKRALERNCKVSCDFHRQTSKLARVWRWRKTIIFTERHVINPCHFVSTSSSPSQFSRDFHHIRANQKAKKKCMWQIEMRSARWPWTWNVIDWCWSCASWHTAAAVLRLHGDEALVDKNSFSKSNRNPFNTNINDRRVLEHFRSLPSMELSSMEIISFDVIFNRKLSKCSSHFVLFPSLAYCSLTPALSCVLHK